MSDGSSNRLQQLFKTKSQNVLSVYFTAGYPQLNSTIETLQLLQDGGVDIVEVGMPFSDPLADGPVIQESSRIALQNGMSMKVLFEQLANMRKTIHIPVLLMGYINPVLKYGVENFCKKCNELGIDGVILPDLPLSEYLEFYKPYFDAYDLCNVNLVTPQTSDQRIKEIDARSNGFVYVVSSAATTGAKQSTSTDQIAYFERIKGLNLQNKTMIGFGISNKATFDTACKYANGAIIGSAFIQAVSQPKPLSVCITEFLGNVR